MSYPSYIPSFYFSQFAQGISAPFTALKAYKAGAIDERGRIVKPESSIDPFEYFIIKLKQIFEELPSGMTKAQLNNYLSTLSLFSEEVEKFGIKKEEYVGLMEGHLTMAGYPQISLMHLLEDMGVGGMAAPASSPGYNTGQVSGTDPVMAPMQRRKPPVKTGFEACEMFDVCPEEIAQFKNASDWKYVPEGPTKKYLRRYQLRNPNGAIALRSVNPDTGEADIHWVSLKPKKLKEYKEQPQDTLTENASNAMREVINRGAETLISPPEHHRTKSGGRKRGAKTQAFGSMVVGMYNLLRNPDLADDIVLNALGAYKQDVTHQGPDISIVDPRSGELKPGDIKGETTTPFTYINQEYLKNMPFGPALRKLAQGWEGGNVSKERVRASLRPLSASYREDLSKILQQGLAPSGTQWAVVPSGTARGSFNFPGLATIVPTANIKKYSQSTGARLDPRFTKELEFRVRGGDILTTAVAPQLSRGAQVLSAGTAMREMERHLSGKTFRELMRQIRPEVERASQS